MAANIRKIRKPEPYKGKGVRYAGEVVTAQGRQGREVRTDMSNVDQRQAERPGPEALPGPQKGARAARRAPAWPSSAPTSTLSRRSSTTVSGRTLASASSVEKALYAQPGRPAIVAAATAVGKLVAERAKAAGVTKVVFDRGGFMYHGRVAALADAARESGLEF